MRWHVDIKDADVQSICNDKKKRLNRVCKNKTIQTTAAPDPKFFYHPFFQKQKKWRLK